MILEIAEIVKKQKAQTNTPSQYFYTKNYFKSGVKTDLYLSYFIP